MAPSSQPNDSHQQQADDLLATQKLLRATLDASMDMIQVFQAVRDQQGQIIDFTWTLNNHTSEKMYGDVVGKSLLQQQPGVVEEGIFAAFNQVMETGQPQQYEKHYVHEQFDGWFHQSVVKLHDGVATTTADITHRKRAEEQLQQSQALLQSVINSSLDVIQVFEAVRDETGSIQDFRWVMNNQRAVAQNGDVIGKSLLTINPGVVPAGIFDRMVEVAQTGIAYEQEQQYAYEQFDGWFYQALVKTDTGLAMTIRDITQAKQAEQQILRLKDELAQTATDKYRTLFDSIDEGVAIVEVLLDQQQRVADMIWQEANPSVARQTGGLDFIGKRASEVVPHLEPEWLDALTSVYQTGQPVRMEAYSVDLDRWIDTYYSQVGGSGSPFIAAVFQDITQRKRHQLQKDYLLRLSDALRTLSDPKAIQQAAMQLLGQQLQVSRAFYGDMQADQDTLLMGPGYARDTFALEVQVRFSEFDADLIAYYGRGQTVVMADVNDHPLVNERSKAEFAQIDCRAAVGVPLLKEGKVRGILSLHQTVPRHWTATDISLAQETAERTWAAVERAKAEAALSESQQRFESIANLVPDLLWDSQPDGVTNWYNQRWLDYTGQHFEEAIGWGWIDAIHPDDREASSRRYGQAVVAGTSFQQLHRIRRHDGEYRWFVVSTSPLKDPTGQVVKMYGAATDIHDRKLAEEALQRREAELARVQQIGLISGVVIDVVNQLTGKRSPEYLRLHGLPADTQSETHADWLRQLHPDDRQPAEQALLSALQGEQSSYESEYRIIRPNDGRLVWIYAKMDIERNGAGSPVRLVGIHIDITRRKQAEEALARLEQRNRLAIEAAELATWEWDLVSDQVYWNEQHFRLLGMGIEPNPLPAQAFLSHLHPDDAESIQDQLRQAIAQRTLYDAEFRIVREDGVVRWMSGYGRVTKEQEGQPVLVSGVMMDITERKQAEEALHQADQRKDEFLAMLAHELRNPMSTIRSGLHILILTDGKDEPTGPPVGHTTIEMMNRQTDHLVRMVDDLLDISRISQGKIELHKSRVDLVELARQAVDATRPLFTEQGRSLHLALPTTSIYLEGDATRLTQVIANLLTNGVRYTGEAGQVWLRLASSTGLAFGQEAILEVRDNGIGLAADQLAAIFELFMQVDNTTARSKGGLGLGLTLVKRLVEMHGGRVQAQSEGLGKGSTFRVYLPTLEMAPAVNPKPVDETPSPTTHDRILVIDDNADAAFTLAMLLKLKGYEAHTRHSGRAGLEAAEALHPSAIVLDLGMPGLDGYETCRQLRQQSWGEQVPVIALSGYGQEEDRQRTKEAGFTGHLIKPVDLDALLRLLAKSQLYPKAE
ncbi:hypothetical protein GCM10028819_10200 [Spirosoma humi]